MPYLRIETQHAESLNLFYEDQGTGDPVVFVHAWPLNSDCWEKQVKAVIQAGYRAITFDRRGFGRSARFSSGYDYATMAHDLYRLMEQLDLKEARLVGFSMGGGEIAKLINDFGSARIAQAIFIASVPPRIGMDDSALAKMNFYLDTLRIFLMMKRLMSSLLVTAKMQ